jgi:hypothetical protein
MNKKMTYHYKILQMMKKKLFKEKYVYIDKISVDPFIILVSKKAILLISK